MSHAGTRTQASRRKCQRLLQLLNSDRTCCSRPESTATSSGELPLGLHFTCKLRFSTAFICSQ